MSFTPDNLSVNMETITFIRWPHEFDKLIQIDERIMIEKYFSKKVRMLLEPMGKVDLLESSNKEAVSSFFE